MAITFDWPEALRPARVEWDRILTQTLATSMLNGQSQAQTFGAPRWKVDITTGPLKRDLVPQWEALIDQLDGSVNLARIWDWRREAPLGVASGAPTVRLAASGLSVASQGWTPNVTGILLAGSWLGINGELKRLTASVNSDSLGRATLPFWPPLRHQAPATGAIVLTKPTALFKLISATAAVQEGGRHPGFTLSLEEEPT